jgi:hypothetical protein
MKPPIALLPPAGDSVAPLQRVFCSGQPFVIIRGRRVWIDAPPVDRLPDLLQSLDATAQPVQRGGRR